VPKRRRKVDELRERRTAVGYARVSTDDQAGHTSLHSQEERIREWYERKGFELVAMFWDEGAPAYTDDISRRPGLATLLELLPELRPATVVVYRPDRLTRNLAVASERLHQLSALGIALASVTE
jgi:DNA invertase Pin-like site-specific DNA recombinase